MGGAGAMTGWNFSLVCPAHRCDKFFAMRRAVTVLLLTCTS